MEAKRKSPAETPALGWRNKARRKFTAEERRAIVEECFAPGASVSAVGLRHGINNAQLFKWRRQHLAAMAPEPKPALLPVTIEAPPAMTAELVPESSGDRQVGSIEIELSGARIRLHGAIDPKAITAIVAALKSR